MNKLIICLFAIVAFAGIALADELDKDFKGFLNKFKKDYSNLSKEEVQRRQKNFLGNLKKIEEHNNDPTKTFKLGVNKYTDYEASEFVEKMCRVVRPQESQVVSSTKTFYDESVPLAASVDWSPYFQPVADQGECGASWAFAVVALIEAYNSIKGYNVPKLSVQNVLDCDNINSGCDYGWPGSTLRAIRDNMGNKLASEKDYPYTGKRKNCRKVKNQYNSNIISIVEYNFNGNETEIMKALSIGPLIAFLRVTNNEEFVSYSGGVFTSSICSRTGDVNHAVAIVGYGTDPNSGDFWIVRNSWSLGWGEKGYIRIARGGKNENMCNVSTFGMQ